MNVRGIEAKNVHRVAEFGFADLRKFLNAAEIGSCATLAASAADDGDARSFTDVLGHGACEKCFVVGMRAADKE